ncbi:MAG: 30S ribosomal protein S6 [Planctomycetota bacterium]
MDSKNYRLYEGLFLVDSGEAASDWEGVTGTIRRALQRGEARMVSIRKWNECKLAYEIEGRSRGTYILTYFNASGPAISQIEREVQLSERILRVLILRADHVTQEVIEKEKAAMGAGLEAAGSMGSDEDKESVPVGKDVNLSDSEQIKAEE